MLRSKVTMKATTCIMLELSPPNLSERESYPNHLEIRLDDKSAHEGRMETATAENCRQDGWP